MKPADFDYFAPTTVDEALALLDRHGEDAKILAGGQSLVPMMNFRLVRPKYLIDINRIAGLSYIKESNGDLRIGAMTRHREVERSPVVERRNGLLYEGVRLIGHGAIRARGTIGGSIVHADPTAELPSMLAALDGEVVVVGPTGRRSIKWNDFFLTYFTTSLETREICEEIVMPALPPNAGWAFEEFTHRHGDFAMVGVAAVVELNASGQCTTARLAVAGAGATPVRARRAEQFLQGQPLTAPVFEEAGRLVAQEVEPEADLHASEAFRRHLAGTMAARALVRSAERVIQRGRKK
jgi:CO/xanthine dehydrogenase FAD-binding subunit